MTHIDINMNTKPIFDFLNEIELRTHYQRPSEDTTLKDANQLQREYYQFLRRLKGEFEACLFQCMSEDSGFNTNIIVNKLCNSIQDHEKFISTSPQPLSFGADRRVALMVAQECLMFLVENEIIKPNPSNTKSETEDRNPIDTSNIVLDKPVYTATEIKTLLGISDSTFNRWISGGWISYTQMEGSDKKFIKKEDLYAFLNNKKIFYPSNK